MSIYRVSHMNTPKHGQSVPEIATHQDQLQELLATGLKLPGIAEALGVYAKAIQSLPSAPQVTAVLYATDVNSACIK